MADDLKVQVTLTAPVRVSWPQVFEPKAVVINGKVTGEPFFSARLVFPADHADIQGLRMTASQLLGKLKPDVDLKTLRPYQDFFYPFKSGAMLIHEAKARIERFNKGKPEDQHKTYRGFEDYMDGCQTLFVKAAAKYPPQLDVYTSAGKYVKLSAENRAVYKDLFYNGMMAIGAVTLAGVKLPTGGWGVTAYLNGLAAIDGGGHIGQKEITYSYIPSVTTSAFFDDEISL
jgi:hypothetical protein